MCFLVGWVSARTETWSILLSSCSVFLGFIDWRHVCPLKVVPSTWRPHPPPLPPPPLSSSLLATRWPWCAASPPTTCPPSPWKCPGWPTAVKSSPWIAAGWWSQTHPPAERKEKRGRRAWSEQKPATTGWGWGGWPLKTEGTTPAASERSSIKKDGGGTWQRRRHPTLWLWRSLRSVSVFHSVLLLFLPHYVSSRIMFQMNELSLKDQISNEKKTLNNLFRVVLLWFPLLLHCRNVCACP